jgi:hypothetical protein
MTAVLAMSRAEASPQLDVLGCSIRRYIHRLFLTPRLEEMQYHSPRLSRSLRAT